MSEKIDIEDVTSLLYWLRTELDKGSQLVVCEEGSAKFTSMGAVNSHLSRLERALHNDGLKTMLIKNSLGISMSKQNNFVGKVVIDEEGIQQSVGCLYEYGCTPSDKLGFSHEELYFGRWVVDEEPYELLKLYHMRADNMENFEAGREFSAIRRYLKEKGYTNTYINNSNYVVLDELENVCVTPIKKGE